MRASGLYERGNLGFWLFGWSIEEGVPTSSNWLRLPRRAMPFSQWSIRRRLYLYFLSLCFLGVAFFLSLFLFCHRERPTGAWRSQSFDFSGGVLRRMFSPPQIEWDYFSRKKEALFLTELKKTRYDAVGSCCRVNLFCSQSFLAKNLAYLELA